MGNTIHAWRLHRGLTVTELAEKVSLISNSKVTKGYISNLEHGRTRLPRPKRLDDIAKALDVSSYYLFLGYKPENFKDNLMQSLDLEESIVVPGDYKPILVLLDNLIQEYEGKLKILREMRNQINRILKEDQ